MGMLILKGLLAVKSTQFDALCGSFRSRFIDSKRVKWRKFGEMSQIFLFNYFPLSEKASFTNLLLAPT